MTEPELREWMRQRLLAKVHDRPVGDKAWNRDEATSSQWCPEFEQLMRNRILVGAYRYGDMRDQNKGKFDQVGSAIKRLQRYKESGNAEHLVDAANLCLVEFRHPNHPDYHFEATDDGEHAEPLK